MAKITKETYTFIHNYIRQQNFSTSVIFDIDRLLGDRGRAEVFRGLVRELLIAGETGDTSQWVEAADRARIFLSINEMLLGVKPATGANHDQLQAR